MPRSKPWIPRVPQIISDLEASQVEQWDRRSVQSLFQIPASSAKLLMAAIGARVEGRTLVVSREQLLQYLACSPEGQEAAKEARRRRQFARNMTQVRQEWIEEIQPMHEKRFMAPTHYKKTRLKNLRNVTFEPGELRIRFRGRDELASTLLQFAYGLMNDWDKFESICLETEQMQPQQPTEKELTAG
jgi:hypothetical protein